VYVVVAQHRFARRGLPRPGSGAEPGFTGFLHSVTRDSSEENDLFLQRNLRRLNGAAIHFFVVRLTPTIWKSVGYNGLIYHKNLR